VAWFSRTSRTIRQAHDSRVLGAAGAAKDGFILLDTVADYSAAAVLATGREGMDGALEGVECVPPARHRDGKRFVIVVSTNVALSHRSTS
jgi:hypothetical protein